MSYGLCERTITAIVTTCRTSPRVKRVILYGSRAKGTYRKSSDIDLCLDAPGMDLAELLRIEFALDALDLPWQIDLSLLHTIENPALTEHILRVGVELQNG